MSSGTWLDALSAFVFDVTVTLTTAGVTRAANVSIARSIAVSALTLLASSETSRCRRYGRGARRVRLDAFVSYNRSDQG